jgi:hypothetical protein
METFVLRTLYIHVSTYICMALANPTYETCCLMMVRWHATFKLKVEKIEYLEWVLSAPQHSSIVLSHTNTQTHAHAHAHTTTHTHIHAHIYMHTQPLTHTFTCTHIHAHTTTCTHIYMHTHSTHTHTNTCTHTHTCSISLKRKSLSPSAAATMNRDSYSCIRPACKKCVCVCACVYVCVCVCASSVYKRLNPDHPAILYERTLLTRLWAITVKYFT